MTRSPDIGKEPRQDELSSLVAKEVVRVLACYDEVMKEHGLSASCVGDCRIAPGRLASPARQQAIHDDLAALASGFVDRLAAEATRRLDAGAGETAPPAAPARETPRRPTPRAGDRQGDFMRIQDWAGQVAGPTYLEEHYGIPRSTLHWWQRHNDVVALRKGARKHVFPLAQFVDCRPAPGIRQVLASIGNPRLAWLWLTRPCPLLDGRVPIEMLRQDMPEEVILAAGEFASNADLLALAVMASDGASGGCTT
ncbi:MULTISPECIES: antitoxin Xre/MbcA/ParS toxin-binding domain-containing protein [unclassified Mesorhizobium]|uniref:antitoxin Xre/MbcA/ParS-like domain-containing protein n=1 Tax=unclassified Mesorhizobium TaxID=325217 RepID=UPI001129F31C|nr:MULTISPECIES: antitoxin Xre/MbcA/ParS toxin-binding domain-containing protein [unclassified Mesorhizobium]TPK95325.1 DUF2384 domain-containing protein [Mesorhizobium sp. B2-4-16]TPL61036.1 DUF2384 domain-containing protein [Mesorhizobium sp. B2-4-3]